MRVSLLDSSGHVRIAVMRIAIDKERVFPIAAATGSLVDMAEIDLGISKDT